MSGCHIAVAAGIAVIAAMVLTSPLLAVRAEATTTLPCSAPDVYCGTFEISSANLTAEGNHSVLNITLLESGSVYMSSATAYINGTIIGTPVSISKQPGNIAVSLVPKQQTTLSITIPSTTMQVQGGGAYNITVYAWVGTPSKPQSYTDTPQSVVTIALSSAAASSLESTTSSTTSSTGSSASQSASSSLYFSYFSLVVVAAGVVLASVLLANRGRGDLRPYR